MRFDLAEVMRRVVGACSPRLDLCKCAFRRRLVWRCKATPLGRWCTFALRLSPGRAVFCCVVWVLQCRTMSTLSAIRLPAVPGSNPHRTNELLLLRGTTPHHVVYFPGDVQSYEEIMACHPENVRWKRWSFENAASLLSRRFPNSHIWVVRSSRMHLHKFSCYDNFVRSNLFGAPEHGADFGAFKHLYTLLVNAFMLAEGIVSSPKATYFVTKDKRSPAPSSVHSEFSTNGCPHEKEHNLNYPIVALGSPSVKGSVSFTLIGFSKGCVVLNQLLYELKNAKTDPILEAFISNIKSMYWLDGGHPGGGNTWVTCPDILEGFAETGILVHTHVTPYQVHDTMRSWIGKEHRLFVQILQEYGVPINTQLHFAGEVPSLDNHFRVHEVF